MSTYNDEAVLNTSRFAGPGSVDYRAAVHTFNLSSVLEPVAATTARTTADVLDAITDIASNGGRILPISTGHASSMIASQSSDSRIVRVQLDAPVTVNVAEGTVTIPAGTTWASVIEATAEHGFAVPHGSSPTVGAIGYLLGGGMSFYGRCRGIAANHIDSITLATADGEQIRVDRTHDAELFWALRGGGGGFGIVLSIDLRMYPMWRVITGSVAWGAEHADAIARAWNLWTQTAPRSITTSLRLLNLPPIPETPEVFRGRQIVMIDGSIEVPVEGSLAGAQDVLDELMHVLRAVAEPLADTWHLAATTDLPASHADPQDPLPYASDHFLLADVDDAAMTLWVASAGLESGSTLAVAELRQLGGAFAEQPDDGGAVGKITGQLCAFNIGVLASAEAESLVTAEFLVLRDSLQGYITAYTVPTMVENPLSPRRTFDAAVEDRIDRIRSRVDPGGIFALDARGPL